MRSVAEIFSSHEVLDEHGRHVNGTDKNGPWHQYGDAYESILSCASRERVGEGLTSCWGTRSTRDDVRLVMEVGVADGSCLLAWREVFPNALIVGMDVHPCARAGEADRIEFHLGDQRSKADCERVAALRQFDLIVDDATHEIDATLLTLYWLWPYVRPGGLYVVEEWPSADRERLCMWPQAELVGTCGPRGKNEPLVVFRKPA